MITKQIANAMLAQVERVNDSPERLREIIAEQDDQIEKLKAALAAAHDILDQVAPDAIRRPKAAGASRTRDILEATTHNGKPVLSVAEAADRARVNYFTAVRYLQSGWWRGELVRNRWMVYADQPLTKKRR